MALSAIEKQAMIAATHGAAWDMIDDMNHMRETVVKPQPTSGDLRRMSSLLRRLLIDSGGDIRKISPPRLGRRLHLTAPDVHPFLKDHEREPCDFASLETRGIFGLNAESLTIGTKTKPAPPETWTLEGLRGDQPETLISLRLDGFLSQPVLYYDRQWISRAEVIKFVANVAGGVHSGDPKEPDHIVLQKIRQIGGFWLKDGQPALRVHRRPFVPDAPKALDVNRYGVDFVLLQLMAAARYLTISPDIIELEQIIRAEKPA
jgi:hypothetical protein